MCKLPTSLHRVVCYSDMGTNRNNFDFLWVEFVRRNNIGIFRYGHKSIRVGLCSTSFPPVGNHSPALHVRIWAHRMTLNTLPLEQHREAG